LNVVYPDAKIGPLNIMHVYAFVV